MKCSKHPKYKVMRKPTADCEVCRVMWELSQITPEEMIEKRKTLESRRVLKEVHVQEILKYIKK